MTTPDPSSDHPLVHAVVEGLEDKKGQKICIMDLRHLRDRMADYFVISQAESGTQLRAMAESVQETVKARTGLRVWGSEGQNHGRWILLDYADVVVHLFLPEIREFYNLEKLWNDARMTYPQSLPADSNPQ
jgi:ribosome-associated protein